MIELVLSGLVAIAAQEELEPRDIELVEIARRSLWSELFDPSQLGIEPEIGKVVVRAQYSGDDYDWPVWALAIEWDTDIGCNTEDRPRQPDEWRAIVHRSAVPPNLAQERGQVRPRARGIYAVRQFALLLSQHPETDPEDLVAGAVVERFTANNEMCGSLVDRIHEIPSRSFLGDELHVQVAPRSDEDAILFSIHADRLNVELNSRWGITRVEDMVPRDGNIARWAVDLVEHLETCWSSADFE